MVRPIDFNLGALTVPSMIRGFLLMPTALGESITTHPDRWLPAFVMLAILLALAAVERLSRRRRTR